MQNISNLVETGDLLKAHVCTRHQICHEETKILINVFYNLQYCQIACITTP